MKINLSIEGLTPTQATALSALAATLEKADEAPSAPVEPTPSQPLDATVEALKVAGAEVEQVAPNLSVVTVPAADTPPPPPPAVSPEEVQTDDGTAAPPPPPPLADGDELAVVDATEAAATESTTGNFDATLTAVEVDSKGRPWNAKIHSGNKGKLVKTGEWKLKRGVDKALVDQINAELDQVMAIPAVDVTTAPAADTTPPPPPPATAPETPATVATMPELMTLITGAGLPPEQIKSACEGLGIAGLPLIASRPDLIPQMAAKVEELIALNAAAS